ncbi:hypothetical protein KI387_029942, partial [Taxus chinensis]
VEQSQQHREATGRARRKGRKVGSLYPSLATHRTLFIAERSKVRCRCTTTIEGHRHRHRHRHRHCHLHRQGLSCLNYYGLNQISHTHNFYYIESYPLLQPRY